MKKILMVAVILVATLAFLALPESQAGAGKPVRWKATFDNGGNLQGYPLNGVEFVGGVDGVDITNGTGTCTTTGNVYSFLQMRVYAPSQLNFVMGNFLSWSVPDSDSCGFPLTSGLVWPYCAQSFLNNNGHPTPDYGWVLVRFNTCSCTNTIPKLTEMPQNIPYPAHMLIEIWSHIWDCPANSTWAKNPLHNLMMNAHGWKPPRLLGDLDVKIVRTSLTEWKASVETEFDNQDYQDLPNSATWENSDYILGQSATCVTTGKGKNASTMTYHYPWAKAPLKFDIKFTQY